MATGPRPATVSVRNRVPDVFAPVLARLEADAIAYFGIAPLRLVPAECDERPFSHVLRLSVCRAGDDHPISHLFVKVLKPKAIAGGSDTMRQRVAVDFDTTRRVYASMLPYKNLGAVPPVACYPEHLAIVTEQVEGQTLLEHLRTEAAWFPSDRRLDRLQETMATVGRWIRVFQSVDAPGDYLTVDRLRQYIDHRLDRLVRDVGGRFTQDDRGRVLQHLDRLGRQIAPQELREVAGHADMALGNIIVSGRRIVVLDFEMAKLQSSLHDVTRVFVQIGLLGIKPHLRAPVVRRLQRALLDGFDPSLTVDLPLFRLLVLLHRVNHLTTLTVTRAPFAEAFYNRVVNRQHRRWIAEELDHPCDVAERP